MDYDLQFVKKVWSDRFLAYVPAQQAFNEVLNQWQYFPGSAPTALILTAIEFKEATNCNLAPEWLVKNFIERSMV